MNKFIFIGNLTQDAEPQQINDKTLCRFTIAVNRTHKAEGQPDADFFNISAWGKLAENCGKYLSKGKKVGVSGRIQNRTYEDKETGAKRYATDYFADDVEFLSAKNAEAKPTLEPVDDVGDMPF